MTPSAWPRVVEIACPFGVGSVSYAYALDTPQPVLIDTGVASSPAHVIVPALRAAGIDPSRLEWILLTHGHWDHAWGAAVLQRDVAVNARVAVHAADLPLLEDRSGDLHIARYLAGRQRLLGDDESVRRVRALLANSYGGDVRSAEELSDGDVIPLGEDLELRVIHTPGHSPGSVTFVLDRAGWAFAGDAVQGNGSSGSSRFPLYIDPAAYRSSLDRLAEEITIERLFLGHRFLDEDGTVLPPVVAGTQTANLLRVSQTVESRLRHVATHPVIGPTAIDRLAPAARALGYDHPAEWPSTLPTTLAGYASSAGALT